MSAVIITSFLHQDTSTYTHVLSDRATGCTAIIDPVLDFDQKSGRTSTISADQVLAHIRAHDLTLKYVLETHAHADHLSSADYIRRQSGARVVIGKPIVQVQQTFGKIFNEGERFKADGQQFDLLLGEGDELTLGNSLIRVMNTPGHTPACISYVVNDRDVFVGDTLFMPDIGTARCDFPGGDAGTLYDSIQRLLALGDEVVLHLCHDYPPADRPMSSSCTVADQKAANIHVRTGISRDEFIALRTRRDATLDMPRLILPSLQVNIRAGALPEPEANGVAYLKLPLNLL